MPLPAPVEVMGRGECNTTLLSKSEVRFLSDGTFEHIIWIGHTVDGPGAVFRTSYTEDGKRTATLWGHGGAGQVRGDTLELDLASGLLCARYHFTGVEN